MLKRLAASVLALGCVAPAPGTAQEIARETMLPERFGSCWVISEPMRTFWRSPLFEHPIRYGELGAESERVGAEFLGAVRASSPSLPADEAAYCTFWTTRAEGDAERRTMRNGFRFSRVDFVELPWQPSPAPAVPKAVIAPATPAPQAAVRADTGDIESDYWNRIVDSRVAEDFDDYLKAFPKGRHAPLAQLEAKRLRRGGTTAPAVVGSAATSAAKTGAIAEADASFPIDEAVRVALADAAFRIPAGHGAPLAHAGRRINMVGEIAVPVAMDSKLRRDAGDLCRLEQTVAAGEADIFETRSEGLAWAGLLPLSLSARSSNKYAISDMTYRATAISHQGGALFPLVEGAAHAFSTDAQTLYADGKATSIRMALDCRVGATGAATAVVAGMAGQQTALHCTLSYPTLPTLGAQEQVFHWFSDAGCFVQDPTLP